jgi:type IV secretion system protein VirB11
VPAVSKLRRDTSTQIHLERFAELLEDPEITEIAINGPDEVFAEAAGVWRQVRCIVSETELLNLGTAVGRLSEQEWNEQHPLLSASVPLGCTTAATGLAMRELRLQLARPPVVPPGTVSITIRKPALVERTLAEFGEAELFEEVRTRDDQTGGRGVEHHADARLAQLFRSGRIEEFLRAAVRGRKNIVVAGATGSGKTTFMKALVREIPIAERLITIEDVRELNLPHPNRVHLLYSKGDQSSSRVTARDLLEASLRMKPSRILLAELRGSECLYYVRNAASGHPGSITSVHAGSPELAFEQMAIMIKDSPGGAFLDFQTIQRLLRLTVDVVVQFQNREGRRSISGIWFEPRGSASSLN